MPALPWSEEIFLTTKLSPYSARYPCDDFRLGSGDRGAPHGKPEVSETRAAGLIGEVTGSMVG